MAGEAGNGFEEVGGGVGEYLLQGYVYQWHGLGDYPYGKNGEVVDGWWIRQDPIHHSHPQTNQVPRNYHSPLEMEEGIVVMEYTDCVVWVADHV